uniref:Uncharacterized protein n=1 Tax=Tetranychus urticae TaxID=32264 RepID=T1KG60_TETUR
MYVDVFREISKSFLRQNKQVLVMDKVCTLEVLELIMIFIGNNKGWIRNCDHVMATFGCRVNFIAVIGRFKYIVVPVALVYLCGRSQAVLFPLGFAFSCWSDCVMAMVGSAEVNVCGMFDGLLALLLVLKSSAISRESLLPL